MTTKLVHTRLMQDSCKTHARLMQDSCKTLKYHFRNELHCPTKNCFTSKQKYLLYTTFMVVKQ